MVKFDKNMENSATNQDKAEINKKLAALQREEIDAEFAEMANDTEYLAEVEILNQEFASADWEAFKLGESQLETEIVT
ncbi:hypothetical protein CAL7716_002870 [Calothrix sp. PCC 7716]|nr:hypothetical protein CAL7716_002870 [Calothrix sp. PCC 7716]